MRLPLRNATIATAATPSVAVRPSAARIARPTARAAALVSVGMAALAAGLALTTPAAAQDNCGSGNAAGAASVACGTDADAATYGTAVGNDADAGAAATAVGALSRATSTNGTAVGVSARATGRSATALGYATGSPRTNPAANVLPLTEPGSPSRLWTVRRSTR